jgi:hypothetical protein
MMTLSMIEASVAQTVKNAACYHLVTLKTSFGVRFFTAVALWNFLFVVLDLFSRRVTFHP